MSINTKNQPENNSFVNVVIPCTEIKVQYTNIIDDDSMENFEEVELPL